MIFGKDKGSSFFNKAIFLHFLINKQFKNELKVFYVLSGLILMFLTLKFDFDVDFWHF
jgi:hypothetical protein